MKPKDTKHNGTDIVNALYGHACGYNLLLVVPCPVVLKVGFNST
jgi:hypothetical protein